MFRDMTFCQERKCSFFPSCERAWTRELEEEAEKYKNIEVWFFLGRPLCFDKGLEELEKVYEINDKEGGESGIK